MHYPEPPQQQQQQGAYPSAQMDLELSPESYSSYSRPAHEYATTIGYDNRAMYAAEAPYMYGNSGKHSPVMYADDSDMHVPSSNLSIDSASSSNMGSPLSNHGQLAPMAEWAAPQGLGVTPGIVDQNDYFPGTEYSFAPNPIDGFNPTFDFPSGKGPGFVGLGRRSGSLSGVDRDVDHGIFGGL
ncbi:hypothetical protein B0T24DRAFT_683101 [Lasiosphaeria ovina]|uniref:Uncharacterized protein n=1 Tax=Lasiosphaeria ovina TaxID=92902 RepID=A0AAE0JXZ7_9PEZI|nr:hypothetical protein B0T24DRAFT_683101 [Lasiosphaeria ovina]